MLLGLYLVTLTHGQQSVEVLGLGAYVVQKTGCKCFWVLKTEMVKHVKALQVYFYYVHFIPKINQMDY